MQQHRPERNVTDACTKVPGTESADRHRKCRDAEKMSPSGLCCCCRVSCKCGGAEDCLALPPALPVASQSLGLIAGGGYAGRATRARRVM